LGSTNPEQADDEISVSKKDNRLGSKNLKHPDVEILELKNPKQNKMPNIKISSTNRLEKKIIDIIKEEHSKKIFV